MYWLLPCKSHPLYVGNFVCSATTSMAIVFISGPPLVRVCKTTSIIGRHTCTVFVTEDVEVSALVDYLRLYQSSRQSGAPELANEVEERVHQVKAAGLGWYRFSFCFSVWFKPVCNVIREL